MHTRAVLAAAAMYIVLMTGFVLLPSRQARLQMLVAAISIIGVVSAYFIGTLGTELLREVEGDA